MDTNLLRKHIQQFIADANHDPLRIDRDLKERIYVFEVQTKGSIDSLILNLLKSLNNPAVQGVVAVSDSRQLERIKSHARDVSGLREKLKFWDYEEILRVHEGLEFVNASINNLGLVPQGF